MQLEHRFDVPTGLAAAHDLLIDLQRVAPCLPGAEITEQIDDRHYQATMAARVGPMALTYRGEIAIVETAPEDDWRIIMHAEGKDVRARGNAKADITMTLSDGTTGTHVEVLTDLTLTGRVAQMGRSIVRDVANAMMEQFVENLSLLCTGPESQASTGETEDDGQDARGVSLIGAREGASAEQGGARSSGSRGSNPPLGAFAILVRIMRVRVRRLIAFIGLPQRPRS